MENLLQIAVGALDECQQPDQSAPRLDYVIAKVRDNAAALKVRAKNVGFNWDARPEPIALDGQAEGVITVTMALSGERPTFIQTTDPNNSLHVSRNIPITDPANVTQFYWGAEVGESVQVFSHWRDAQGQLFIKAHPYAAEGAQPQYFKLWLESGEVPKVPTRAALPALADFDQYLKIRTARAILPVCEWSRLLGEEAHKVDPVTKQKIYAAYRADLMATLDIQIAEWDRVFRNYVVSGWDQASPEPRPYGGWLGASWS